MNIAITLLPRQDPQALPPIGFIGGGNMASAILGGLIKSGSAPDIFEVVEPDADARTRLSAELGLTAQEAPTAALERCALIVWAVKPQVFSSAAASTRPFTRNALHLSIAAGIASDSIAGWLSCERVVRAMPNTPALIGKGMTGLYARSGIGSVERDLVGRVLAPTGALMWLDREADLDAVTAMSGSGPAYVFYFLEAMIEAGRELGLDESQARALAFGTFNGATALAMDSDVPVEVLRQRVTSKGGTTHAALATLEAAGTKTAFKEAIQAASRRAAELGREFGSA